MVQSWDPAIKTGDEISHVKLQAPFISSLEFRMLIPDSTLVWNLGLTCEISTPARLYHEGEFPEVSPFRFYNTSDWNPEYTWKNFGAKRSHHDLSPAESEAACGMAKPAGCFMHLHRYPLLPPLPYLHPTQFTAQTLQCSHSRWQ